MRVFVSSTLQELAPERAAAREAIVGLRLTPVMFELGARPHPPRELYRAYLAQSDVFVGLYWQRYGWVAPGMDISGLEDEYRLSGDRPKLIYVKDPAPEREPGLNTLLDRIRADDTASYKPFATAEELRELIEDDLALLLTERFVQSQLAAPGPSSTPGRPLTNLPVQRSPLIGREREVAAARALLLRDDVGLLTLTGPAGIGKTRLALHVANELREHFADGVFVVPLAALADPAEVPSAIAQTLDIHDTGGRPVADRLADELRDRRLLLVLDNFEQILPAATLVAGLLAACPQLKVLATSRTPLHVQEEKELDVPPLALPDPRHPPDAGSLTQYAAVELFIRRAQDAVTEFTVTEQIAPTVAEICRRLDGVPLAIELAAARVRVLPPPALLARLERRLPLLTGGAQDLPARQRTMRSAIAWSYDLLDAGEQALFRRLAVFAGGCTLDAAEAVCADSALASGVGRPAIQRESATPNSKALLPTDAVLEGMASLADKSLLRIGVGTSAQQGEAPRFTMLETIREFALERLAESGEEDAMRRRHADYYVTLLEEAQSHLDGPERGTWLGRLEAEQDNLRVALGWRAAGTGDAERGRRLVAALAWFWYVRGYLGEGQGWLEDALDWNYELLAPGEQALFRRLAVFAGGCTLDAVAAVCMEPVGATAGRTDQPVARIMPAGPAQPAAPGGGDLPAMLDSLVSTGLLQREDGADGAPRFTMRAPIRDYALKRLRESGEEDAILRRHAAYHRAMAGAGEAQAPAPNRVAAPPSPPTPSP